MDLPVAYRVLRVVLHGERVQMIVHQRLQRCSRQHGGFAGLGYTRHYFTPAIVRT